MRVIALRRTNLITKDRVYKVVHPLSTSYVIRTDIGSLQSLRKHNFRELKWYEKIFNRGE